MERGYEDRMEYFECLSEDYGVDIDSIVRIADILGEAEDFDGLIDALTEAGDVE